MATVIRLYIGHNVDGRQPHPQELEYARGLIEDCVAEAFDGATLYDARGIWRGARGLEKESTTIVEVLTEDAHDVARFKAFAVAESIRRELRQEAVAVESHKVDFDLVTGGVE